MSSILKQIKMVKEKQLKKDCVLVLNDIRSVYNVGAIFRTADAIGVSKIYLSGITPSPIDRFGRERGDLKKTALGAEKSVAFEQVEDLKKLVKKLKMDGFEIIGIEQSSKSIDYKKYKVSGKTALMLGSEEKGLSKKYIALCDEIIEIPMSGEKESLNVSVAFGIVAYILLDK